ncbi:hypothetical protein J6590_071259 [Homalodisca vitripennis]|nr:hypothetical protein J6590_071259 [Homalodisca vitripennis]
MYAYRIHQDIKANSTMRPQLPEDISPQNQGDLRDWNLRRPVASRRLNPQRSEFFKSQVSNGQKLLIKVRDTILCCGATARWVVARAGGGAVGADIAQSISRQCLRHQCSRVPVPDMLPVAAVLLFVALASSNSTQPPDPQPCPPEKLTTYRVVLHTFWTRDLFPKHYPEWRPPAQWSKLIGRSTTLLLLPVGVLTFTCVPPALSRLSSGILDLDRVYCIDITHLSFTQISCLFIHCIM